MWQVFSPDGFPIFPMPYSTRIQAKDNFKIWAKRFEEQGYYSTVFRGQRVKIPLNKLEENCVFKEVFTYVPYIEPQINEFHVKPF
jgi:hypothetical protein